MNRDLPIRICGSAEMRELDLLAEAEFGLSSQVLMENAGLGAVQILLQKYPHAGVETEVLIFAGKGNNAGDAFVVARRLICQGRKVRVFHLLGGDSYVGPTQKNFEILKKLKAKMVFLETASHLESFFQSTSGPFTIVDGMIGTGLKGDLGGIFYDTVEMINRLNCAQVVSLDIPSGVNGDTGKIHGSSIMATLTVSFGFPKLGHFLPPGATRRGELHHLDISLPPKFAHEGNKFLLLPGPLSKLLHERDRYGHKNSFGHTLLIGGSPGRIGAIVMAARACHKMGTGLVTVSSWEDAMQTLALKLPSETMCVPIHLDGPEHEKYRRAIPQYSCIVVGPGLGLRSEAKQLLKELLMIYSGPLVLDADALNLIAEHRMHDLLAQRQTPAVLTPHLGEMARLLDTSKEAIQDDPVAAVQEAVKKTHSVVILKGAATLVGSSADLIHLNHYPNDGMATAGSGDVLAGMIGGLLGQKMSPSEGTLLGIYLHSLAGDFAARQYGHRSMTANDIIENIGNAFQKILSLEETTHLL